MALLPVSAQQPGESALNPDVLAIGNDLLQRAPEREVDGLFQAVHGAMQDPGDADTLCGLFDPSADRSLDGLNAIAARLGPGNRQRMLTAVVNVLLAAWQSPPQADDRVMARQALKSAGVTAALLHDGFVAGLNTNENDEASRAARCRSLRWLLDAIQARPANERAAMTRLLLQQGLEQGKALVRRQ